jgi:tRNA(Ile)-lysidine synthase
MYNRVKAYIAQNQMITGGDHIVAGVSGGADSVCLFFVLLDLQKEIPFTMQVVHVNHMLRPEAEEDAAFVADLCRGYQIPCKIFTKDVAGLARQQGISIEEAGREYRYACFREALRMKDGKIAVAHHQDDRAETILFHLFRGSGLRGLTGIRPVRDNIIRPLLCLTRQEIEEYLGIKNIPYRIDDTNQEDIYARNRIRRHIIPFAAEVNSEAVRHMAKTADLVWEAESYLHKHTEKAFAECVTNAAAQISIDLKKMNEQDIIIKKRVMIMAVEKLLIGRKNISAGHIESLIGMTITGGSQKRSLPHGLIALKEYDSLVIKFAETEPVAFTKNDAGHSYFLTLKNQELSIPNLGMISIRIFPYQKAERKNENIPKKTYTKWLDYDKITSCANFRRRLPGDFLIINQKGQHKKLKAYLINEKIPKARRDEMYVFADGSHIIWVPGLRISEHYKITDETKMILEVTIAGGGRNS